MPLRVAPMPESKSDRLNSPGAEGALGVRVRKAADCRIALWHGLGHDGPRCQADSHAAVRQPRVGLTLEALGEGMSGAGRGKRLQQFSHRHSSLPSIRLPKKLHFRQREDCSG